MSQSVWYQRTRLAFAALIIAAIIGQLRSSMDLDTFNVSNFFSFFTIQSNIVAAVVLWLSATMALSRRAEPAMWGLVRGAAAAYMATTGIVFAALLAGLPDDLDLTLPWVNFVLHQLMPVVIVLDWLLSPPRERLTVRGSLVWIVYPLLYCVYSLIRGPIVDWYPYPFLDPREPGGYPAVAAYSVGIAVLFLGLIWLLVTLGNAARGYWANRNLAPQG